jgi:hypothetical protein
MRHKICIQFCIYAHLFGSSESVRIRSRSCVAIAVVQRSPSLSFCGKPALFPTNVIVLGSNELAYFLSM